MKPDRRHLSRYLNGSGAPDETACLDAVPSDASTKHLMAVYMMCGELLGDEGGAGRARAVAEVRRATAEGLAPIRESDMSTTHQTSFGTDQITAGRDTAPELPDALDAPGGRRLGALPCWMVSTCVHTILIFLTMLIVIRSMQEQEETALLNVEIPPPEKKKEEEKKEIRIEKRSQVNIQNEVDRPFYTPEKMEVTENEIETENEVVSEHPAKGHQDAVSTIPAEGTGTIGFFGVGGGGASGAFGWRMGGGRKRRAMAFGGSEASEKSVDLGLEWLYHHQEPDGYWDRLKYGGHENESAAEHVGVTGLALLAFLGAGHTERHGKYKDTVQRAVAWLRSKQQADGLWGPNGWRGGFKQDGNAYRNVIATMALSEAAGMSRIPKTRAAAQRAVEGIVARQEPYGAFGYGVGSEARHINDTSVTIWAAMALKSAKVAGLSVPGTSFEGVLNWVDHAQDLSDARPGDYAYRGGRTGYRGTMAGSVSPRNRTVRIKNLLTAAGGLIRIFWGQPVTHPGIVGPANILLEESLPGRSGRTSYYECYYATLLIFQKGGEHWKQWNVALQSTLLAEQQPGDPRQLGGSWNPDCDNIVSRGGRVFSTSLCVLSLEVYYRYLPMYSE